ncbi:MAG: IS1 family transposase [Trichodesmium sp. MO_231.B1]|nr:IS1 family transposase [Trichodesmium sp. MO_231.B1]
MYQKKTGKLTIQCDEMWSFVGHKNNKQWLWLAIDIETKEILGFYLGERGEKGVLGLWNSCAWCLEKMCSLLYRFMVSL